MKSLFLATLGILALASGSAMAADMAPPPVYKAPPPPPPTWTGFYVGAGGGYGMWNADTGLVFDGAPLTATVTNGGRGWEGLVNAGYDYQFNTGILGNAVAGVFADYNFDDIKGWLQTTTAVCPTCNIGGWEKETAHWDVGARAGILVTPGLLTYVDGGYTEARFSAVAMFNQGLPVAFEYEQPANTYHGWFVGTGYEFMPTFLPISGLTIKTEYRYSSYNTASLTSISPGDNVTIRPYEQTITTSLVWRFNWLGPIAARD